MYNYFSNIYNSIKTLCQGMMLTLKHFNNKEDLVATLQYPHEKWPIPERNIGFENEEYNLIRSRLVRSVVLPYLIVVMWRFHCHHASRRIRVQAQEEYECTNDYGAQNWFAWTDLSWRWNTVLINLRASTRCALIDRSHPVTRSNAKQPWNWCRAARAVNRGGEYRKIRAL